MPEAMRFFFLGAAFFFAAFLPAFFFAILPPWLTSARLVDDAIPRSGDLPETAHRGCGRPVLTGRNG